MTAMEKTSSQDQNSSSPAIDIDEGANVSAAPEPQNRRRLAKWFLAAFRDLGLSVVIAILIVVFIFQPVKVEGTSMMPSIGDQQRIFVDKFFFQAGISEIHRGDVVVFWFPRDQRISYIKRVIGVPGDVVSVRGGQVLLNGQALDEPYVPDNFRDAAEMPAVRLGDDEYFVMGDHRNSSNDSRAWGPVHRQYIYGKALFAYWPLEEMKIVR
jgi:signal peptidase I